MDKIDIYQFDEEIIYWWDCPKCDHQNEECGILEELKNVNCGKCYHTFEIVK
jgi:hypothetical protein